MAPAPLVVTTRSLLRGSRHVPLMHRATRKVMRELHTTPGAQRVVSLVAGHREFWSVSVWSDRSTMQAFMRSGAHGTYLWEVGRWLESFWLMRWRPTPRELGSWDGREIAPVPSPTATGPPPLDREIRERILAGIPTLAQAYGPCGAPTYHDAPEVRWDRELVGGTSGVLVRAPAGARALGRTVLAVGDAARADPDVLRVVDGRASDRTQGHRRGGGRSGHRRSRGGAGTYLLCLWSGHHGPGRTFDRLLDRATGRHDLDGLWACDLRPEHEFGRWDDLRVRDLGLLRAVDAAPQPRDLGT